ncbi:alpha-2,8-sialyltransferase 8E-like [Chanos chanos]|uniref:Alpha-2,8-sialyltransferase 8E-like n=1 Tax=Chanos chanos TaxID=29144 RepID=A0A6J2VHR9_CHACN|nr:alpha-2,8-sialyltransferase 8E-like [Chanos chanos]
MAVATLKWIFRLLTILTISHGVCVIFQGNVMLSGIDIKKITEELKELMDCPVKSNITQRELNRVRLHFSCNASGTLILTKQNTALNQTIQYETNTKVKHKVNPELYDMLPQDFPWNSKYLGQCAVVGSGGILKNSSCGAQIDSADFVIRFNMAPINDSDVGLKSDLVTVNPSQIRVGYKDLDKNPGPLVERVSVYGNASLILPAFAYTFNTQLSFSTLKALRSVNAPQKVVFFSPSYLKMLDRFWKARGLKEIRLSTGFMLINVALELCEHVHIYGFWPFDVNLDQQAISHHYYDDKGPSRRMHSMPQEFLRLLQLHSQGALTMHLQPCA